MTLLNKEWARKESQVNSQNFSRERNKQSSTKPNSGATKVVIKGKIAAEQSYIKKEKSSETTLRTYILIYLKILKKWMDF
jgi:hypothetical protein